jgi:acyl-coenzyme A thioesterase PaaI-like protein
MSGLQEIYRVYRFDPGTKVVTADFIRASTDEEAIAEARATEFGTKCEVWHGRRLVAELEGDRRQA